MSLKVDNQNKFVLISSLILDHCALNFPCSISLDTEELYRVASKSTLEEPLERMSDMIEPTITWLTDEEYIRKNSIDNTYSITEKGLTSINFKVNPAPSFFRNFTKKQEGSFVFFRPSGWNDEYKLKLIGPALSLLPENWYQFD